MDIIQRKLLRLTLSLNRNRLHFYATRSSIYEDHSESKQPKRPAKVKVVRTPALDDVSKDKSMTETVPDHLQPSTFLNSLQKIGVDFFCGVPDSLLKDFCGYMSDSVPSDRHVITANEGSAVAVATGYHVTTARFPMVYMQNSGIGNALNPLVSLTHKRVYRIPLLLMVGWRGEPGKRDEPQHGIQGQITPSLLATLGIPFQILPDYQEGADEVLETARQHMITCGTPYCLVVRKNTFAPYAYKRTQPQSYELSREEAIIEIAEFLGDGPVIVATTGMISRELYEYRASEDAEQKHCDFLTVGSMGHASAIALGVAMNTTKQVVCLDGDGSAIMHLGNMTSLGQVAPRNLTHILLNNGCHDSVGGQPTAAGFNTLDFTGIARACGYKHAFTAENRQDVLNYLAMFQDKDGPHFLEVKVRPGHRPDLGRPKNSPVVNKQMFQKNFF